LSFLTSGDCATMGGVKILLRNPKREVEVVGPVGVLSLLRQLGYQREAVLVIVNGTLVTEDATIAEGSEVEVRPVISGGAVPPGPGPLDALPLRKGRHLTRTAGPTDRRGAP
jgi:sulfur carrier protein